MESKGIYPPGEGGRGAATDWIMPAVLVLTLLAAEGYNHALFHTLAELFAIMVALLVAVVGWQAYPFSRNQYLLALASGYFWIAGLDLGHTLTYKGIGVLPDTADASIQFWIAARYLEALVLVIAPFALVRPLRRRTTFAVIGAMAILATVAIFTGRFPTAFIPGQGLTPFKVVSEFVIIALLIAALAHVWHRRAELDRRLAELVGLSIACTAAAEFFLTTYSDFGQLPTVIAHLLKFFSYWLIYVGMIGTTLTEPFRVLAHGASTFDAVPDPTVVVDENGIIRQTNRAARNLLAAGDAELVGSHCHPLLHDTRIDPTDCPVCHAIADGRDLDEQDVELAALGRWHLVSLSPVRFRGAAFGLVHVSVDVTERVRSACALRKSEARFRGLVESTNDWVWEVDEDFVYTYASPQVSEILGYAPDEIVGKRPTDLMPPDEAERVRHLCAEARADHSCVKGLENVNIHRDGHPVVLETNGAPFFDEDGVFRGFRGIDRDVTERKRIEQELDRHRNHLEQLVDERTAALEAANRELAAFSYSVSHDLRAPLRAIDGFSRVLVRKYGDDLDAEGHALVERIHNATLRMAQLIDDMLQLARLSKAPIRVARVDLSAMAADITADLRDAEPERTAEIRIEDGLSATGDAGLLQIVLENVLGNAWKFTAGRAPAEITFGRGMGKDGVHYFVRDNGAGFDMRYVDKLFGAFQRLHRLDEFPGTGIGLATVQRVIHRHGGKVWAEGEVGRGATLYFTLPERTVESAHSADTLAV